MIPTRQPVAVLRAIVLFHVEILGTSSLQFEVLKASLSFVILSDLQERRLIE